MMLHLQIAVNIEKPLETSLMCKEIAYGRTAHVMVELNVAHSFKSFYYAVGSDKTTVG